MAEQRRTRDRRRGTERRDQFERRLPEGVTEPGGRRVEERRTGRDRRRFRDRRDTSNCPLCGLWAEPLVRCPKCGKVVCPSCSRIGWLDIARRDGGWAVREILLLCAECGVRMPEELRHRPRATKGVLAEWLGISRTTLRKLMGQGCCTIAGR
jgi:hypothetical protein